MGMVWRCVALFSSDGTISFSRSATASIAGRPNGKRVRHWGFFLSVARESREACAAEISRCTGHALTADQLDRCDSRVCLSHIVKDANGDFPPQAPGFFPAKDRRIQWACGMRNVDWRRASEEGSIEKASGNAVGGTSAKGPRKKRLLQLRKWLLERERH